MRPLRPQGSLQNDAASVGEARNKLTNLPRPTRHEARNNTTSEASLIHIAYLDAKRSN
jgi:hypothetical protein